MCVTCFVIPSDVLNDGLVSKRMQVYVATLPMVWNVGHGFLHGFRQGVMSVSLLKSRPSYGIRVLV